MSQAPCGLLAVEDPLMSENTILGRVVRSATDHVRMPELARAAQSSTIADELVDVDSLAARAAAVAGEQGAHLTRQTHAGVRSES